MAAFAIKAVECGASALPALLDIAYTLIEPFVLRRLDIVLGREAADGARELLDLGFALGGAVLRHRGHAGGVESLDEMHHLRQVCLGEPDALGVGDRKRLAHGGDKAATLLGALFRGTSVRAAVGHAGLVDAVVEHEFGPHAVRDVCLDGMGDAAARVELINGGNGLGVGAGGRAKTNLTGVGKSERAVEEYRVHALADSEDGVLPAKALGNLLLAGDTVAKGCDERVGAHDVLHGLESLVESGCLDCEDDQIGGCRLAGADGLECAGLAVDGERVVRMALKASIVHDVFDGVVAEGLGNHAAVEQAHAALADKGDLVDLHMNHLPI